MAYWLDDGFDTWPETIRAGSAAAGLYVRCGSWIARNTQDGLVPAEVAAMYGTTEWVAKLVAVGLWEAEGAGYRDVRYHSMGNPTADVVRKRRADAAERQRRLRENRVTRDKTRDSRRSHSGSSAVSPGSPALPSPLQGEKGGGRPRDRGATRPPDCPRHRGYPADNCGLCRSERLGREPEDP
jgi:hypothetical protein